MDRVRKKSSLYTAAAMWPAFAAIILAVCIVLMPDQAFQASLAGLTIWWQFVFPSLLPFFMLSEMLYAYGVVHGAGSLLDPLMRRVFRLPGSAGLALSASLAGGFPAAADLAAKLHRDGAIGSNEAGRMASLFHLSSPLTIVIVIGAGFFSRPEIGGALAIVHYASGLLAALLLAHIPFRTRSAGQSSKDQSLQAQSGSPSTWSKSVSACRSAAQKDGRSFGRLLGDTVTVSVQKLLALGACMIMFSVIAHVFGKLGGTAILYPLGKVIGWPSGAEYGGISGLFEAHLGAFSFSRLTVPDSFILPLASACLAWGGFSGHLQALGLLHSARISYLCFAGVRLLHAGLAYALYAAWGPGLQQWLSQLQPVFVPAESAAAQERAVSWLSLWPSWPLVPLLFCCSICLLLSFSFIVFRYLRPPHKQ
ncbi:nucleoside recognition domain-containing protein [Paenibacillus sp. y28]|uniref:nucleoside recognition domain-containing protein n=1 Tax=Paenibacillus sp. y28 TaxID=3129110 RepID=UPI0030184AC6